MVQEDQADPNRGAVSGIGPLTHKLFGDEWNWAASINTYPKGTKRHPQLRNLSSEHAPVAPCVSPGQRMNERLKLMKRIHDAHKGITPMVG